MRYSGHMHALRDMIPLQEEAGKCCVTLEVTLTCTFTSLGPAAEGQSPASHRSSGKHPLWAQPVPALGEDREQPTGEKPTLTQGS